MAPDTIISEDLVSSPHSEYTDTNDNVSLRPLCYRFGFLNDSLVARKYRSVGSCNRQSGMPISARSFEQSQPPRAITGNCSADRFSAAMVVLHALRRSTVRLQFLSKLFTDILVRL